MSEVLGDGHDPVTVDVTVLSRGDVTVIEGLAACTKLRRFQVTTAEQIK